jgi:hypothetical protein
MLSSNDEEYWFGPYSGSESDEECTSRSVFTHARTLAN